ncbi:MAG: histidine kinase dimerization/phospho-acceptor domain-containing protein [Candidatus Competibacteraceae bacterium]|jgi:hypothetical protein|nr:histidine kinase dimerization/phospho-acceptor domain-containing protein [Candidatus Competibacteraceae bacterium]
MNCQRICPFYGQNVEQCDVGFGYISPYHVEVMVRHCTSRYENCGKYQELALRKLHQDDRLARGLEPQQPAHAPVGGVLLPLHLDREVVSLINHTLRTPLTSIRSFTEILRSYQIDDPEAQRHFLDIIHEEAQRLTLALNRLFSTAEPHAPGVTESKSAKLTTDKTRHTRVPAATT